MTDYSNSTHDTERLACFSRFHSSSRMSVSAFTDVTKPRSLVRPTLIIFVHLQQIIYTVFRKKHPLLFSCITLSFNGFKHLTEKVTAVASLTRVWVVVNHTMSTPLQRSTKLKISH